MTEALSAALKYVDRGWQVFPLKAGDKIPLDRSHGFKDATSNPATIQRWFGQAFNYNVGLRTGMASGVWVVDVDGDEGAENLAKLERENTDFPQTLICLTPRGRHYYFRTNGLVIQPSAGRVAPHVDVRAENSYVVAPPSVHPNGTVYRWNDYTVTPALAPDWLIRLAQKRQRHEAPRIVYSGPVNVDAYGQTALENEIKFLSGAPKGTRNHALNRSAFCLYQLVAGGELFESDVESGLIAACQANGLIQDDGLLSVRKTLHSAKAGFAYPRNRRGRA